MPDWYEVKYGFDIYVKDGNVDADSDGFTNLQEFENGTDPRDELDNMRPTPPEINGSDGDETGSISIVFISCMISTLLSIVLIVVGIVIYLSQKKKKDEP